MKLRYTSLQHDTGAAEEDHPDLPAHAAGGVPVVACSLHSQVAVVAAVARHLRPGARIAYVMTDGAALPLALSDLVHALRERGVVDVTVTAGHAFGGDLEAVAVPSALALARHVAGADLVVVGMGRGWWAPRRRSAPPRSRWRGSSTPPPRMGARVALCCRASSADPRPRHRGVSHHVRTDPRPGGRRARRCRCPPPWPAEVAGSTVVDGPDAADGARRRSTWW